MNLLCIAVDRLHVGYLGCYGNTWVATPAFDRLASNGFVFDQAVADTLDPTATYDAWWRGSHAVAGNAQSGGGTTFAGLARRAGLRTWLAADAAHVLEHPAGVDFDDVISCLPAAPGEEAGADVAETHTARLFAEFGERIVSDGRPFAAWLHAGALGGAWDAPMPFRERYRGEDDPPVPTFTTLPDRAAPPEIDLDERFGFAQAYAGQIGLLDACLGGLLEQLEESGLDADTIVAVCGLRGLALGEHGVVGHADRRLYAENVRLPWIVRRPDGRGRLRRSQALVQPCDWLPTVAEWLQTPIDAASGPGRSLAPLIDGVATTVRDRVLTVGPAEFAIRTPRWSLRGRETHDADHPTAMELFVKPDDFWEVNDVADRCPDVVAALQTSFAETQAALAAGAESPPLPEAERMFEA